ncbi:MlaD family protein [Amorphus orientalis]|uniref:Phospholipid/cholesterol/gamma-HCH transport system substrate-binding protein n=1 Tax=Amorphus orientalis TaxID=649198 RepID=A0AAE4AV49_9HYPH|nr:MCE family protein [Amorphus orientalis]MDQ0316349.1 phospholipid/cholesterol/gamma-HCH transport system substrate-binding protein [Amorphus orientalis]
METRANYIAVGLFVIVVVTGALGFVYWLYSSGNSTQRTEIQVVFDDPVTGLSVGSPVIFNGIRIGEVTNLGFVSSESPTVLARAMVDRNAPLKTDTKAELGVQGLTGVSYISLSGGKADSQSLFAQDGVPKITAQRSAIQDLLQGARDILEKADTTVENLNRIIEENRGDIAQTVSNVETFSKALADNSDNLAKLITDISNAGDAIANVAPRVESLVSRADDLLGEVSQEDVRTVVDNVVTFSEHLTRFQDSVQGVITNVSSAAEDLQQFAQGLNTALTDVDQLIQSVDPTAVRSIVDNVDSVIGMFAGRRDQIDSFIENASESAANLREVSQTLSDNNDQIERFMASAGSVAQRADDLVASLQPAANRVDSIIGAVNPDDVQAVVGNLRQITTVLSDRSQDIDGFIADARESAANLRTVSQTLSDNNGQIEQFMASATNVADRADSLLTSLQPAADRLDGLIAAIDPSEVRTILANVREVTTAVSARSEDISAILVNAKEAATSARTFADSLQAQAPTVDHVAENAREISDKLNAASTRVNTLVDKVSDMVEGDGQGFIQEATEAARAIKVVAQEFESRAGTISSGLARFSTTGVDDFASVMTQARQTLREIERTFSNIDRDPSRVIFGGPNGPRYEPQRR